MVLLYLLSINRSDFSFPYYLVRLEMASTRKTIEYKSLKHITQQRVLRLNDRVFVHLDSFNINPTYNTDGIVKCLLQPGQIRNQLFTSMLATSIHLLNLMYRDSSCCRDKVSRAAVRRAVGSVFCSPFIKCTVASKSRFHYRDWQKTRQP